MSKSLLILLSVFLLQGCANNTFSQSGNPEMDQQIRSMIVDLKMDSTTRKKFMGIYQAYGNVMKEAMEEDVGLITLYYVYKSASEIRDSGIENILTPEQFKLYYRRQKKIDKEASKGL
ncbi:MAG: hypothetical protein QNK23_07050 [Crocinitomicaceae bacterium]|nr:hypothetical protein [Crocinitomicaceae bacterium]